MMRLKLSRATLWVSALVGVFLLVLILATASLIWNTRQAALHESEEQAMRFVNGAEAALNRSLLGVDVLLTSMDELLGLSNLIAAWIDTPAANHLMHGAAQQNLMVRYVALLDAQGRVMASSDPKGATLAVNLPAGFVQQVLAQPVSALSVSAPTVSFASSEWVLYFARSIKLADSSRIVALAQVQISLLSAILIQGVDIKGLEVTLERSNGQLLASVPPQEHLWGQQLAPALGDERDAGHALRLPSRLGDVPAIVVNRPILSHDVLIAASIPIDAALADWRQQKDFILVVTLVFALMLLAAGAVAIWHLRRLAQARRALVQSAAEIKQLAFFDPLTGLPNRRLLMDRLQHAMASNSRSSRSGALLFLDLDHFKTLNDTLGHDIGDLLLQQVAQRLKACVRAEDTVARLSGDEFVLMLEDLSEHAEEAAATALHVGEKILDRLNQPYELKAHVHHSTPSIGATLFSGGQQAAADLLKQADIAMYQVKAQGRNALCFFDPQMQATLNARAQLEEDLQAALRDGEFELYYQPQFERDSGLVGAEVLIRWHHPLRGLVPPLEFIAVAEQCELILPIGQWVLRTACQQLANWQRNGVCQALQLSVNVSARQFRQTAFAAKVAEVIHETGANPNLLKLELTESLVLDNVDDAIAKMSGLKALGLRFSMDDFGTGYSSLAYLTRLPMDQLKIDQSFVRNIAAQESDAVIVQTIIGMARNLGLEVIAEGVETPAQQEFLARNGCTLYQGYLFGKPMPLAEFEALAEQVSQPRAGALMASVNYRA